jgi:hypothetical protein
VAIAWALCLLGAGQAIAAGPPPAASVTVAPLPGAGGGPPVVSWTTGNGTPGEMRVSSPGGRETTFALGSSGAQAVPWMRADTSYVFRLYARGTDRRLLASTQFDGGQPTRSFKSPPGAVPRAPAFVSTLLQVLPWITICLLLGMAVAYVRDERTPR